MEILVTGGTGTLGRVVVEKLQERGHVPRVLSRREGPGRVVGDLETGAGMRGGRRGVDAVVHAASRPGHDVAQAPTCSRPAHARVRSGRPTAPHLVFVSIVGVDRVPLALLPRQGRGRAASSRRRACRGRSCAPPSSTTCC